MALAAAAHAAALDTARLAPPASGADFRAPILVYHRFGPAVRDSMTVRTSTFEWQLRYLKEHGFLAVPLRDVVAYFRGDGPAPPDHAVVITADDGHETVFTDMAPLVRTYAVPVTLFVYPSAISNASYAMTWAQLQALRDTGRFDIQSHTYWHPNFDVERKRLDAAAYRAFATTQLCRPRAVLRDTLRSEARFLAWPFGIHNDELIEVARACGYDAALTLEPRAAKKGDRLMALPRYLVTDASVGSRFAAMLR